MRKKGKTMWKKMASTELVIDDDREDIPDEGEDYMEE